MIHEIAAIILGIIAGTFTGMTPGIHINLIAVLLVSISGFLAVHTSVSALCMFIVSMAITHTFIDAIPSIFLGMPSADMVMALMPGHRLLARGRGHEAVKLTVIGSLLCLVSAAAISPILVSVFPWAYQKTRAYVSIILSAVVLITLSREKGVNRLFWAVLVFAMSGMIGMISWVSTINQPLFPMLSGLFGISSLIISLSRNVEVPPQEITEEIKPRAGTIIPAVVSGTLSGSFTALFPGIGASEAAVMATSFYRAGSCAYLITVGGINTVNLLVSVVTFFAINRARSGAVAAMMQIAGKIDAAMLAALVSAALIAGGISAVMALKISALTANWIGKVNYRILSLALILFVSSLCLAISGPLGFLLLIVSASIGIMPHIAGVGKRHCMGCLLVPVIVYFI